jgi:hypothetical protein
VTATQPQPFAFRSIYRGRVVYAMSGRLLAETPTHLITATVPGDDFAVLESGDRLQAIAAMTNDATPLARAAWHTHRVVWLTPHTGAYALGHFFDGQTGRFKCYYVNLQAPGRRTPIGLDSLDQVLDVVIQPDGSWRWKDEDELAFAVGLGVFSPDEAAQIRREGELVIASLPELLPTGWEDWQPDPDWLPVPLPPGWDRL